MYNGLLDLYCLTEESLDGLKMIDQGYPDIHVFMNLLSYHWDILVLSFHLYNA